MATSTAPRIYCLPAAGAPVVAVFRRGPSAWWHIGRWDLRRPNYLSGAWLKGSLYPRRSDLSSDGRWLCYFALRGATWDVGDTYIAISRLPWLKALAAWSTCGTWTRGFHFVNRHGGAGSIGSPDFGVLAPCLARYGLRETAPIQFAAERRLGWREASDCPRRDPGDIFDEKRNARLHKARPGGHLTLGVESVGSAGGEFSGDSVEGLEVRYWLEVGNDLQPLEDLQWADWDVHGRLLAATRSGKLQIRVFAGSQSRIDYEVDLSTLRPQPSVAPKWAQEW